MEKDFKKSDFALTQDYCLDVCPYTGCCLLFIAMEQFAVKSVCFEQEKDEFGERGACTYILEEREQGEIR